MTAADVQPHVQLLANCLEQQEAEDKKQGCLHQLDGEDRMMGLK